MAVKSVTRGRFAITINKQVIFVFTVSNSAPIQDPPPPGMKF